MNKEELLNKIQSGDILSLLFKDMLNHYQPNLPTLLHDLNKGELGILGYLAMIENHVSAGILSEKLKVSTARIASVLNSLEKKNYVIREKSKDDKRKIVVSITRDGLCLINKIKEDFMKKLRIIVNEIGIEELYNYLEMTKRIDDILNKDGGNLC